MFVQRSLEYTLFRRALKETLHPDGGARIPMIEFVAHGMLEDGRSFQAHATLVTVGVTNVRIAFR